MLLEALVLLPFGLMELDLPLLLEVKTFQMTCSSSFFWWIQWSEKIIIFCYSTSSVFFSSWTYSAWIHFRVGIQIMGNALPMKKLETALLRNNQSWYPDELAKPQNSWIYSLFTYGFCGVWIKCHVLVLFDGKLHNICHSIISTLHSCFFYIVILGLSPISNLIFFFFKSSHLLTFNLPSFLYWNQYHSLNKKTWMQCSLNSWSWNFVLIIDSFWFLAGFACHIKSLIF